MPNISIHLSPATKETLENLAQTLDRSRSWVINDALKPYLEHREWMKEQTRQTLARVQQGTPPLVEHEEAVKRILAYAQSLA